MRQTVVDDVVVGRHPEDTITRELAARLAAASDDPIRLLYAAPLTPKPIAAPDGRLLTLAPRTEPVPEGEAPPWREAGALLARLHACPVPEDLPAHGGRALLAAAVEAAADLHAGGSTDILRELGKTLLETWPEPTRTAVVHGSFDVGRLGRIPGADTWVLTGAHTLGVGDPAWDLAGPAGLWKVGLLDDASWHAFVGGYAAAGGRTHAEGAPWPGLEHPARCAVFMATVAEVRRCGTYPDIKLTPTAKALLAWCVKANGRRW